jgi:hypothetical protein
MTTISYAAGPIVAEAIFLNREELPVYPVYYDPVHDFAFLRFDPSKLQFMAVGEVLLAPEAASVGLDIRVVSTARPLHLCSTYLWCVWGQVP